MKPKMAVAASLAFAAMALQPMALATGIAHADSFQSPSGNIGCYLDSEGSTAVVECEIRDHTFAAPTRPTPCMGGFGNLIILRQGSAPTMPCHSDSALGSGPPLQYGQRRSLNALSCDSEMSGMTCTDSSTGHYFRLSTESYEMH